MRIKRRTRRKVLILRAMTSTKVSIWFLLLWAVRLELRTWHIHVLARKCKKEHSLLNLARRELLSWCTPPNSNRVLIWWNAITCSSLHIYFQVFWLTKSIILYHLTKVRRQTHSRVPYKVSHELDACFPRSLQPSLKAKKLLCV